MPISENVSKSAAGSRPSDCALRGGTDFSCASLLMICWSVALSCTSPGAAGPAGGCSSASASAAPTSVVPAPMRPPSSTPVSFSMTFVASDDISLTGPTARSRSSDADDVDATSLVSVLNGDSTCSTTSGRAITGATSSAVGSAATRRASATRKRPVSTRIRAASVSAGRGTPAAAWTAFSARLILRGRAWRRCRAFRRRRHPHECAIRGALDDDRGDPQQHARPRVMPQEEQVVGFQVGADAFDVHAAARVFVGALEDRGQRLRALEAGRDGVPLASRDQPLARLEGLRQLARSRNALRSCPGRDLDRPLGVRVDRVREVHARRDAGTRGVADQPRQLQDRSSLRCGAQESFIGHPLLIERQHVGDRRPGVQQRNGGVVASPRREPRQARDVRRRETRLHGREERAVLAHAIGERGEVPAGSRSRPAS